MNKFEKDGSGANRDTGQHQTSKCECAHSIILNVEWLAYFSTRDPPAPDKNTCSAGEGKSVRLDIDEGPSERPDRSIEINGFGRFEVYEKAPDP